jgi:hypothetical protein
MRVAHSQERLKLDNIVIGQPQGVDGVLLPQNNAENGFWAGEWLAGSAQPLSTG